MRRTESTQLSLKEKDRGTICNSPAFNKRMTKGSHVVGSIGFEAKELDYNYILKISETLHCKETPFAEREKGGSTASQKHTSLSAALGCPVCLFVCLGLGFF